MIRRLPQNSSSCGVSARLEQLAQRIAARPEQHVLGDLHADRAGAAGAAAGDRPVDLTAAAPSSRTRNARRSGCPRTRSPPAAAAARCRRAGASSCPDPSPSTSRTSISRVHRRRHEPVDQDQRGRQQQPATRTRAARARRWSATSHALEPAGPSRAGDPPDWPAPQAPAGYAARSRCLSTIACASRSGTSCRWS